MWNRLLRLVLAVFGGLYLFVIAFPEFPAPIKPGLDPAWIYGINQAKVQGLSFGSQILYTSGPLGYLLAVQDLDTNLIKATGFGIGLALVTAALAAWGVARGADVWRALLCVLGLTAALRIAPGAEQRVLFPVFLALALAPETRWRHVVSGIVTAFAAATLLMKFSIGLSCTATLATYLGLEWIRGRATWRHVAAHAGGYLAALAVLFPLCGNRVGDLGVFLYYSVQLALGYSDAMSIGGPATEVVIGVACLAFLAALSTGSSSTGLRATAGLLLPALLLAYKHAFVRADLVHTMAFFTTFLGGLATLALFAATTRDRVLIGLGVLLGIGACAAIQTDRSVNAFPLDLFDPNPGWARLQGYRDWDTLRARVATWTRQQLETIQFPPELRARLQTGTVDVVPIQATYAAANGLTWNPRPVFQSFAVETPVVDAYNAAHFTAADAPDFVLYSFDSIDGHHPFFDEPAALRALMCHYAVEHREPYVLVLHRTRPHCGEPTPVEGRTIGWHGDVPVLADQAGLQLRLDFRYTPLGHALRVLLRSPAVVLSVIYADGVQKAYRITPALARAGVWIGNLPRDLDGVQALLSGQPPAAVQSFRINGNVAYFEPNVAIEFRRLTGFASSPPAP